MFCMIMTIIFLLLSICCRLTGANAVSVKATPDLHLQVNGEEFMQNDPGLYCVTIGIENSLKKSKIFDKPMGPSFNNIIMQARRKARKTFIEYFNRELSISNNSITIIVSNKIEQIEEFGNWIKTLNKNTNLVTSNDKPSISSPPSGVVVACHGECPKVTRLELPITKYGIDAFINFNIIKEDFGSIIKINENNSKEEEDVEDQKQHLLAITISAITSVVFLLLVIFIVYCLRKKCLKANRGSETRLTIDNSYQVKELGDCVETNKKSTIQNCEKGIHKPNDDRNYEVSVREFSQLSENSCEGFTSPKIPNNKLKNKFYCNSARDTTIKYKASERQISQTSEEYQNLISPGNSLIIKPDGLKSSSIFHHKNNSDSQHVGVTADNYQTPGRQLSETSNLYQDLVSSKSPETPFDQDVYTYVENPDDGSIKFLPGSSYNLFKKSMENLNGNASSVVLKQENFSNYLVVKLYDNEVVYKQPSSVPKFSAPLDCNGIDYSIYDDIRKNSQYEPAYEAM